MKSTVVVLLAGLALAATPALAKDLHPKPHKAPVTRSAPKCAANTVCGPHKPNTNGQTGGSGQTHGQGFIGETMEGNNI